MLQRRGDRTRSGSLSRDHASVTLVVPRCDHAPAQASLIAASPAGVSWATHVLQEQQPYAVGHNPDPLGMWSLLLPSALPVRGTQDATRMRTSERSQEHTQDRIHRSAYRSATRSHHGATRSDQVTTRWSHRGSGRRQPRQRRPSCKSPAGLARASVNPPRCRGLGLAPPRSVYCGTVLQRVRPHTVTAYSERIHGQAYAPTGVEVRGSGQIRALLLGVHASDGPTYTGRGPVGQAWSVGGPTVIEVGAGFRQVRGAVAWSSGPRAACCMGSRMVRGPYWGGRFRGPHPTEQRPDCIGTGQSGW